MMFTINLHSKEGPVPPVLNPDKRLPEKKGVLHLRVQGSGSVICTPMLKRVEVAIGIVMRSGRVLICQRRPHDPLGGYWEFPGGKKEPGESIEQCLVRELAEELAIEVRPIEALPPIAFDYADATVALHPYLCEIVQGDAQPLAAERLEWVEPADLARFRFPPANDALIADLVARARSAAPSPHGQRPG